MNATLPIKAMPPHAQHAVVTNLVGLFRIHEMRVTAACLKWAGYTMADMEDLLDLGWIEHDGLAFVPAGDVKAEIEAKTAQKEVA